MASSKETGELNEKLKKMLAEETERRYQFSQDLHRLIMERNDGQGGSGEQTTVADQLSRMSKADATIQSQLQDLCSELGDVSIREKVLKDVVSAAPVGAAAERDSGYAPSLPNSADMDSAKRQAVLLRASQVAPFMSENTTQEALAEIMDSPSLTSSGPTAMSPRMAGEPTEHTDLSPQDSTS